MFPLMLVVVVQAAAPAPIAVVVSSKRPGAEAAAQKAAARMVSALTTAGLRGALEDPAAVKLLKKSRLNPRDCQGASPCLAKLAAALGPGSLVIGVDVGKIGDSLAIHVEAVTGDAASIGTTDVPADVDFKAEQMKPFDDFATMLAQKLSPPPEVAALPADAPKAAVLEPAPTSPRPSIARKSQPSSVRKVLPWVSGGVAVAAVVVAGIFLGLGAQDKSAFDASVHNGISGLPASELQTISSRGNGRLTIGLSSAIVAAAFGAGSAALFATSE